MVISSRGREYRAYGHYIGDTVARDDHPDRIIIYRDTLERDFGHDPDLLRAQVTAPCATSWPTTWAGTSRAFGWACSSP